MANFLVSHGAWSAGWVWKKMRPLLAGRGHALWTPTYTGIGERAHLAHPGIDLQAHIEDVCRVIECEDLQELVLIGHSYGGMVATGVADRLPGRLRKLVYLDAFVPRDGQSLMDLVPEADRVRMREGARASGDGWRIPPNPMPPDTSAADVAWAMPRRVPQPLQTFEQRLKLGGAVERLQRTYIYCTRSASTDVFRQFAERARIEPGWKFLELDASHNPHITMPETLADLLEKISDS